MPVAFFLRRSAERFPDQAAIYFENESITYRQLDSEVDNLASGLSSLGLGRQQRVGLILGNSPDFVRSYFAIARAGGTVVPINPLYKGEEIKYILNDAEAVFLITIPPFLPLVQGIRSQVPSLKNIIVIGGKSEENVVSFEDLLSRPAGQVEVPVAEDDIAACLYTSGTTGKPKGALLSHGNLVFDTEACIARIQFRHEDHHLCVLPMFHSFCQTAAMLCPVATGSSITILPQFNPDLVLKEISARGITVFCGVPTMFSAILAILPEADGPGLGSLRLSATGGAPMPVEILNAYQKKYGVTIIEGNGPTETAPVAYANRPELCKAGSVGPPLDGVRVKIVDDNDREVPVGEIGEICVQGPNVMKGYLNQPEETAEAMRGGWFHTGDLGKVDEDGYVYIVDRKKDMLIIGGLNVYPREVEECLYQHPKVAENAVIGINDKLRGEIPAAFIVLKPGVQAGTKEFILFCRKYLANYKCPREALIVERLPKNATGKIDKKQLREAYAMGLIAGKDRS